jgi:SAM-dependent methyltransferase
VRPLIRWRRGVFSVLEGLARGLDLASRALLGVGAGILRRPDLARAIAERWEEFGTSEAHVLSGLMPWEQEIFARFLKPDDEILVVGCGAGRDLLALLRAGYRAEGLEVAPRAAAAARAMLRRQGFDAPVTIGAIESVALDKPFDVGIFSWFCYSYIPQRAARLAALRAVAARLKPGGRIFMSYVPCEHPPRRLPLALARLAARLARADWRPEPYDEIYFDAGRLHFEHQFRPEEFEDEARAAGLRMVFHHTNDAGRAVLVPEDGAADQRELPGEGRPGG